MVDGRLRGGSAPLGARPGRGRRTPDRPARDHRCRGDPAGLRRPCLPPAGPLAVGVASALAVDYDLATARVKYLLAERSRGRLEGVLLVEAERRFTVDADYPAAELDLRFEGLDALRFELDDARGVAFDCDDGTASVVIGRPRDPARIRWDDVEPRRCLASLAGWSSCGRGDAGEDRSTDGSAASWADSRYGAGCGAAPACGHARDT